MNVKHMENTDIASKVYYQSKHFEIASGYTMPSDLAPANSLHMPQAFWIFRPHYVSHYDPRNSLYILHKNYYRMYQLFL